MAWNLLSKKEMFPSGGAGMRPCDETIRNTIAIAEMMLKIADEGDMVREDNGCGVLYGVVRDSAFKIRKLAEAEKDAHIKKGWWNTDDAKNMNFKVKGGGKP